MNGTYMSLLCRLLPTHTDRPTHISTSILFSLTTIITITEAKAFNAALADFKKKGAEVFGISSVRTATICLGRVGERGREGGKEGGRRGLLSSI